MEHTKELVFSKPELLHVPLDSALRALVALRVAFTDPEDEARRPYVFEQRISSDLLSDWQVSLEADEQLMSILFQAAQEYVNEKIWQGRLDDLRPRKDHSVHVYEVKLGDGKTACPYETTQPLPQFPFTKVFGERHT